MLREMLGCERSGDEDERAGGLNRALSESGGGGDDLEIGHESI